MKTWTAFIAFNITALVGTALGQVTSPVVGFTTLHLQEGNNFIAFSLQPSASFAGSINVSPTDRTRIYLNNATITDDAYNGAAGTHMIEVTSDGANKGLNTQIIDSLATGSEVVLNDALPAGVADGSTVRITKLRTISEAFGATNSAGLTAGSATTADLVLLPTSAGYDQYFYSSGGFAGVGWRKVGGGSTNQAAVGFYPTDGFMILARTAKSITVTGEVKVGGTMVLLETGNNFVANLCPVNAAGDSPSAEGRTLGNCGLYTGSSETGILGTTSANTADQVLIWNGSGYSQYFYSTGGFAGIGWRLVGGGSTDRSGVALPDGAFLVLRRGAPVMVSLTQGTF